MGGVRCDYRGGLPHLEPYFSSRALGNGLSPKCRTIGPNGPFLSSDGRNWSNPLPMRPQSPSSEFERGLDAARHGNAVGFEYLWNRFSRQVVTFARLQGSEDPEGIANLVFVAVFGQLDRFVGDEDRFVAFTFSIARNKVIDERRARSRRVVTGPIDGHEAVGGNVEQDAFAGLSDAARRALAQLTDDQREILFLRLIADLSLEAVAHLTGRSVGATKAMQHRALAAMKKKISEEAVSK